MNSPTPEAAHFTHLKASRVAAILGAPGISVLLLLLCTHVACGSSMPPEITCPADITQGTDPGQCSALVLFSVTAVGSPQPMIECTTNGVVISSPNRFPVGMTQVDCTAENGATVAGNNFSMADACSFMVTVEDDESPVSCAAPPSGMVSWWPGEGNANDIQDGNNGNSANVSYAAGKVGQAFQFGGGGFISIGNPPNLSVSSISIEAWVNPASVPADRSSILTKWQQGSEDSYGLWVFNDMGALRVQAYIVRIDGGFRTVTAGILPINFFSHVAMTYDAADGKMVVYVNGQPAGTETFGPSAIRATTVGVTIGMEGTGGARAYDGLIDELSIYNRALTGTEVQGIFAADTFGKCKPTVASTATGQCSAVVNYVPPVFTDNCTNGAAVCSPPPGSFFPKGTNIVTCIVTDAAGNSVTNTFPVTVEDNEPPVVTCPGDITATNQANQCVAVVTFSTSNTDNCPNANSVTCMPPSGSAFPVGDTIVNCEIIDESGNADSCSFTITVVDRQLPSITCPSTAVHDTDPNQCSAVVTFLTPVVTDNCPGVQAPTCSPASGSTFPLGTNVVTCMVVDAAGNTNSCTFRVVVRDLQGPVITCSTNVVESTDPGECSRSGLTFIITAIDNCDGEVPFTCEPKLDSTFEVGVTSVECTAVDDYGNTNSCTFTVTIIDTEAPEISCDNYIEQESTPGSGEATVDFDLPSSSDNCDPASVVTCDRDSGSVFPVGVTTVTCVATDVSGNTNTCTITVTVCPHTLTVTNLADSGPGTLRQAMVDANDCPGSNVINIIVSGAIDLTSELPSIDEEVSILGPGASALTVQRSTEGGTPAFRILYVQSTVFISGMTIANGLVSSDVGGSMSVIQQYEAYGGGIYNEGELTLSNCLVQGNSALAGGIMVPDNVQYDAEGGGIYSSGTLVLIDSTIDRNRAIAQGSMAVNTIYRASGGGIYNDGGLLYILSSTISGNTAGATNGNDTAAMGGGIASVTATNWLTNSTISGNVAGASATGGPVVADGGGVWLLASSFEFAHATVANNLVGATNASGPSCCSGGGIYCDSLFAPQLGHTLVALNMGAPGPDLFGDFVSRSYNLIGNADGSTGFTNCMSGDKVGSTGSVIDPIIGALGDNGGPTLTHELDPTSPALDMGDPAFMSPPDFDQRGPGFSRVFNGQIDIGAFELQDITPPEITCPENILVSPPSGETTAVVNFSPTVMENIDPSPMVSCDPASGSTFSLGTTTVTCEATDFSGNTSQCSFTVTISTSFVVTKQLGTLRNNFGGLIGMKITVGSSNVIVTHLGRIFVAGNTGSHLLKIVLASNQSDVPGATVTIAMPGGTPGQFKYAALSNSVTLLANTMYYLVSQETVGGDFWHDANTTVTTRPVAEVNSAVFMGGGYPWSQVGAMNTSYGPVDFQYTVGAVPPPTPQPPSVTITNPVENAVFIALANIPIEASTSADAVSVEFFQNGGSLGVDNSSPFSLTWSNVPPGNYVLRAKATGGNGLMSTSAVVNISVITNQPGGDVAFVTGATVVTLRNNFNGSVGMKITVGTNPIVVTALGRMFFTGNAGVHQVRIVRASDNLEVLGASVAVPMAGGVNLQFEFVSLPSAVTLQANTMYYVVSDEISGGDRWGDLDTTVTTTTAAVVNSAVYFGSGFNWTTAAGPNKTYVPVNFRYQVGGGGPPPVTVEITQPTEGTIFTLPTNVTINANASAGVTNVEFFQNSTKLGDDSTAPYSLIWSNPAPGGYALTAKASHSSGTMATSSVVNITVVSNTPGGATDFVETKTLGTLRNNFGGVVGMKITVGPQAIRVLRLARICVAGNSATHQVKLVLASTLADVPNGSVAINMVGCVPGEFAYANLAVPVILNANTMYFLVSSETAGGDTFYDVNTTLTSKPVATINGGIFQGGGYPYTFTSTTGHSYGPVDFTYDTNSGDVPVVGTGGGVSVDVDNNPTALRIRVQDQQVELRLNGSAGQTYQIESSDDLIHWTVITRQTMGSEAFSVMDNVAGSGRRFYRAVLVTE